MFINENSINVVTVTYGDRWGHLKQIIERLHLFPEVNSIIIIDNASSYSVQDKVKEEFNHSQKVTVITSSTNLGSSGGFKRGIEEALEKDGELIWLLDDDNLPNENAIKGFTNAQKALGDSEKYILCSYREDWKELRRNGGQKLKENTFFQFDLISKMPGKNKAKKQVPSSSSKNLLKCDYAPYGGLLFPKSILKDVGLPNDDYYLYVDDTDFTYRMTKLGYEIFCVVDSTITDLESSWFRNKKEPMFFSFFRANSTYRGLMNIRNRVYFETTNNKTNSFMYFLNMWVYLVHVFLFYMPKNKGGLQRYFSILKAIKLGKKGILGNEIR